MSSLTVRVDRANRIALRSMEIGTAVIGAALVVGSVANAVQSGRPDAPRTMLTDASARIPGMRGARWDSVTGVVDGLPEWVRILDVLSWACTGLTAAVVGAAVVLMIHRILSGSPFRPSLTVAALASGAALVVGGALSFGANSFATIGALTTLDRAGGGDSAIVPGFEFQPAPVIVGFAVLALSFVFQAGERLQRDTEGLV